MRLSSLINLGLITTGAAASVRTLRRRHQWEQSNRRAYIVLDHDDALAVSTRAGMPLAEFLQAAQQHGATHVSLPELTLNRLLRAGRVVPVAPAGVPAPASGARTFYLASTEPELLAQLAEELEARLPAAGAHLLPSKKTAPATLAVTGDLATLAELGLGFESGVAAEALNAGLGVVPRPVSFAWPEDRLVERTLAQAAGLGAQIVAFDGDLILGHEMHLDTTVENLLRFELTFAYFCETRHQKGDWFVAKRLAPHGQVVLSHYFTPAAMVPEDFHSAAHHWGMLAHKRGIRLCYVNVFRRIHATEPLECLHYLEHIKGDLEGQGLRLDDAPPAPLTAPIRGEQAIMALAPAGAAAMAASEVLGLREPLALGASALAAVGAAALPFLDRPRGHLEEAYPPSYAPKLLALAGAAAAPAAAMLNGDLATAALIQGGTAASLAALTTGRDYQMRIEEYRSLNLDLVLPLAAVLWRDVEAPRWRWLSLAALGAAWLGLRRAAPDVLDALDKDLPAGHTHHLSAAQRLAGDTLIALGPRPARKWAGLGLAGVAAAHWLRRSGHHHAALAAALVGAAAQALTLAAFRQPERPLAQTLPGVARSWGGWGAAAVAVEIAAAAAPLTSGRDHP